MSSTACADCRASFSKDEVLAAPNRKLCDSCRAAHERARISRRWSRKDGPRNPPVCLGREGTRDEYFWVKVRKLDSGCWLWEGSLNGAGYGQFWDGRRLTRVHRWVYERFVGKIPKGKTITHCCHDRDLECVGGPKCFHRRCVNPNHLKPATSRQNNLRIIARKRRGRPLAA